MARPSLLKALFQKGNRVQRKDTSSYRPNHLGRERRKRGYIEALWQGEKPGDYLFSRGKKGGYFLLPLRKVQWSRLGKRGDYPRGGDDE